MKFIEDYYTWASRDFKNFESVKGFSFNYLLGFMAYLTMGNITQYNNFLYNLSSLRGHCKQKILKKAFQFKKSQQ